MSADFESFEQFWPFYLHQHAHSATRTMHEVGTVVALGCVAAFLDRRDPRWLIAAAGAGYGFAWASHAFVEGNKPATFSHPLWSFRADIKMLYLRVSGGLDAELNRLSIPKG